MVKLPAQRRRARAVAFQALFEIDATAHPLENSLSRLVERGRLSKDAIVFARELVRGVVENRDSIDKAIAEFAPLRPVQQLSLVDRNILRIAIYELQFSRGTPPKVAVNEAVELAKAFGSEGSPRFVNGVLGALMDKAGLAQGNLPGEGG